MESSTQINPINLVKSSTNELQSLGEIEQEEMSKIIRNLNNKDRKDIREVPVNILKEVEPEIANALCVIINRCLKNG